ncbi:MAG: tripartite tricarboxylate transporter substrate binding protein [Pseudolabrys sp.]|nr:tripartite tricarboxylate transporter substrate binding protein [Pseudolabrys sp.]MBV9261934.1 tripartite tricarboxylate transporter substrate binding protein [Pseudolabrys sp.]
MRKIVTTALACTALLASAGSASAWPDRAVRFIVSLGAGSGVDITARLFADSLSKKWGQAVVVENRPGGDGIVAINAFIGASDDHVLLFTPTGAFSAHPYQMDKVPYDPAALAPIARVTNTIVAFAVPTSLGLNSMKDLLDKVKTEPGKLNWASATTTNEFLFQGYLKETGLDMAKVPYRDTVSAINDLAEGRIQMYVGAYAIMRPQLQTGKIKVLAVTNGERAKGAPEIPTVAEAGFPKLKFDGLVGIFGPTKMPADLRNKIAADVAQSAAEPEIVTRLIATGQNVSPGTPQDFAKASDDQRVQVDGVAKLLGLKKAQ